jgi:hypothetical protein
MSLRRFLPLATLALASACALPGRHEQEEGASTNADDLTGVTSVERGIHFQGQVVVPSGSSDDVIATAIAREVKTAIGALRSPKVSLADRAARSNLDPTRWTRAELTVVDPAHPDAPAQRVLRVSFPYDDRAVVTHDLDRRSAVDFTVLADDYAAHSAQLVAQCSDDTTTDVDSLWYHYQPQSTSCSALASAELDAIAAERKALAAMKAGPETIGPREAARWFLPLTAKLDAPQTPGKAFSPEYDRLFGVGTDKSSLVVYAFFGVDQDENDPDDVLAQEAAKFLRTMLRAQPNFRPVKTDPLAWLLDFDVDGKRIDGVTYDRMLGWIVDQSGYPAEVGTDATKIAALRRQAIAKLAERWIYWDLPVTVNGKSLTIEVRSFYGYEDGSDAARQHAQWRYLEAFWYGDVFLYNGHSHFGHGPLEPTLYGPQNFNDRYQIMLVNSCISYNYYHQDFFEKKPGGTKNLDMVVNGLPSYVLDGGVATARFLNGLISGAQPTYVDLLDSMKLDFSWGEKGYDPMRVVDGELDNVFSQAATPITLGVLPPVYP